MGKENFLSTNLGQRLTLGGCLTIFLLLIFLLFGYDENVIVIDYSFFRLSAQENSSDSLRCLTGDQLQINGLLCVGSRKFEFGSIEFLIPVDCRYIIQRNRRDIGRIYWFSSNRKS